MDRRSETVQGLEGITEYAIGLPSRAEDVLVLELVGDDAGRCLAASGLSVGGHRDLPAGGRQTLPTDGHLGAQRAGTGARQPPPVLPSTVTLGTMFTG